MKTNKKIISLSIISLLVGGVLGSTFLNNNPKINPLTINPVSINYVQAVGGAVDFDCSLGGNTTTINQIIDSFAIVYGYQKILEDSQIGGTPIPNPQTKEDFMKDIYLKFTQDVFEAGIKEQVEISANATIKSAKANAGKIRNAVKIK